MATRLAMPMGLFVTLTRLSTTLIFRARIRRWAGISTILDASWDSILPISRRTGLYLMERWGRTRLVCQLSSSLSIIPIRRHLRCEAPTILGWSQDSSACAATRQDMDFWRHLLTKAKTTTTHSALGPDLPGS